MSLRRGQALDLGWGILGIDASVSDAVSGLARAAICVETFSLRVHEANNGSSDKLLSGRVTKISFPFLEGRETSAPNLQIGFLTPSAVHGRTPFPKSWLGLGPIMGGLTASWFVGLAGEVF